MGCCSSSALRGRTEVGGAINLKTVSWNGGFDAHCEGIEVEGIPLPEYLAHFTGLKPEEQYEVITRVIEDNPSAPGTSGRICTNQPARIGVLSWNVGGLNDNRKDYGTGIAEEQQGRVSEVFHTAFQDIGDNSDVIVVGLQEIVCLTPMNAWKSTKSNNVRNGGFYGWPETVAQWIDLMLEVLNREDGAVQAHRSQTSASVLGRGAYILYAQPVYLFGLLLCVFCRTEIMKHIRDFAMTEKPMDERFHSGAKGVTACRFVLFDRSFCFVNCHFSAQKTNTLAASWKSYEKRIRQLEKVWTDVKFKSPVNQMIYPVSAHRAVFMLGDTNMRLSPSGFLGFRDFHDYTMKLLGPEGGKEGYKELWSLDQLRAQAAKEKKTSEAMNPRMSFSLSLDFSQRATKPGQGGVHIWNEPTVGEAGPPFPPTFKLAVPGPGYSKKRVPAWTDRVLFNSQHAKPVKYQSVQQAKILSPPCNLSDHDPVYAVFDVECVQVNERRLHFLAEEVKNQHRGSDHNIEQSESMLNHGRIASMISAGIVDASVPEIEELSRRLFNRIRPFSPDDRTLAVAHIMDVQEDCWRILCSHLDAAMADAIRSCRVMDPIASDTTAPPMNGRSISEDCQAALRSPSGPQHGQVARLDSEQLAKALHEAVDKLRAAHAPQTVGVQSRPAQSMRPTYSMPKSAGPAGAAKGDSMESLERPVPKEVRTLTDLSPRLHKHVDSPMAPQPNTAPVPPVVLDASTRLDSGLQASTPEVARNLTSGSSLDLPVFLSTSDERATI
mmetsp:Transcript_34511/g.78792  ORF Transcript_34511/g.78792 Transcript_34511/m.78792 type:complete len:776 (-) Transcript_34511:69-2396(-)